MVARSVAPQRWTQRSDVMKHQLPQDLREVLAKERRDNREAAKVLVLACETGDVDLFFQGVDLIHAVSVDGWRLALTKIARLPSVSDDIREAFLPVWIETKMLPLRVGNCRVMADALRVLLPSYKASAPLHIFRGAGARERRHRLYGFSWTTHQDVARKFAEHWAQLPPGGVVLETMAPPEAILFVRDDPEYYDEGEVVVDPFCLNKIDCVERLKPSQKGEVASPKASKPAVVLPPNCWVRGFGIPARRRARAGGTK